jgi:hypothetical protein
MGKAKFEVLKHFGPYKKGEVIETDDDHIARIWEKQGKLQRIHGSHTISS